MKRQLLAVLAALLMAAGLSACGDDKPEQYIPASFGADGKCYYVESADEVRVLEDEGLCERNLQPQQASSTSSGLEWLMMYHLFLSSPAYYNTYVPAASRTVYVEHRHTFEQQHRADIQRLEKRATYRSTKTGKIVPANKVSPRQFGSGARSSGGGSRSKTCGLSSVVVTGTVLTKGGGSTGGGRSGGGGSRSGSSGGSKSRPRSGGC